MDNMNEDIRIKKSGSKLSDDDLNMVNGGVGLQDDYINDVNPMIYGDGGDLGDNNTSGGYEGGNDGFRRY